MNPKRQIALVLATVSLLAGTVCPAQTPEKPFWRHADPQFPLELNDLLAKARSAAAHGKASALTEIFISMQAIDPNAAQTRYLQAVLYSMSGRHQEARSILESLANSSAGSLVPATDLLAQLAFSLARTGELQNAVEIYVKAARSSGARSTRHIHLSMAAQAAMAAGELEQATILYRDALHANPHYPPALFGMALATERRGDHELARGYLLDGLLMDPGGQSHLASADGFIPAKDQAFAAALIHEEQGRFSEAAAHLKSYMAQQPILPRFEDSAQQGLARIRDQGPAVLATGSIPLRSVTCAAADPAGRFLALGNKRGALVTTRLAAQRVIAAPRLAGPAMTALSFTATGDRLLSADEAGDIAVYQTRPRTTLQDIRGPIALKGGTAILAFSSDGDALAITNGSGRVIQLARTANLKSLGTATKIAIRPHASAMGVWSDKQQAVTIAMWNPDRTLSVARVPRDERPQIFSEMSPTKIGLHSSDQWEAVTITADGRRIILAGRNHVAVCRAIDGKVLRLVNLSQETKLGRVKAIVVDTAGGAGHGRALIAVHDRGYRAVRLDLLLESATLRD